LEPNYVKNDPSGSYTNRYECHIYWELAESITRKAAPIYIEVEAGNRRAVIRLPLEIAMQIRDVLEPSGTGIGVDVV